MGRHPDVGGVAVYGVPDPRTGDQVMAAIELRDGAAFDPDFFSAFLREQADLGTKWAPRFVRVVESLPVTGTQKVDKQPLRALQWYGADAILVAARPLGRLPPHDQRRRGRHRGRVHPPRPGRVPRNGLIAQDGREYATLSVTPRLPRGGRFGGRVPGVLVVDDESDMRLLVEAVIARANEGLAVVGSAANGAEAIEQWREISTDVILSTTRCRT